MRKTSFSSARTITLTAAAAVLISVPFISETDLFGAKKHDWDHADEKIEIQQMTIHYPEETKELIPVVTEALEQAERINRVLIGSYPEEEADIVLFEKKEEFEEATGSDMGEGYYTDEDKYLALRPQDMEAVLTEEEIRSEFQSTIVHEYTHYALHRKLAEMNLDQKEIPLWLHEGLSEYTGRDSYVPADIEMMSFTALAEEGDWEEAKNKKDGDVYAQSFLAVHYLIEAYGEEIILLILEETQKEEDFEKGFYAATGINIPELENILKNKYKE